MQDIIAFALSRTADPMDRLFITSAALRIALLELDDPMAPQKLARNLYKFQPTIDHSIALEDFLTEGDKLLLRSMHIST
jgi:hypothetical protein